MKQGRYSARKRRGEFACVLLAVAVLTACGNRPHELHFSGTTMATRYAVTIVDPGAHTERSLKPSVDALLAGINQVMSTYDPQSELSRLNANPSTDWIALSGSLYEVLATARRIGRDSRGAFDITVGPLVNLWGFGPEPRAGVPADEAITATLARVGPDKFELRDRPRALRKSRADVYIDLSGIAKGYAVDEVAASLRELGFDDFLVEIGGEIRASGRNGAGEPWQIGVERPVRQGRELARVVPLTNAGMASSGTYRNYFERDGVRYSHMIDPASGHPVAGALAGVTVIHRSAMEADAWATALMTLGEARGPALAEAQGIAALFFTVAADKVTSEANAAFEAATVHE